MSRVNCLSRCILSIIKYIRMIYKKITKGGFVPFITKGFTFGFEIEGAFHKDLINKVPSGGIFKEDGSVRVNDSHNPIETSERAEATRGGDLATEYASPVFKNIEDLITCLRLFKRAEGLYYGNSTCGVHLHIGLGKGNRVLHNKFGTKEIMEQLQARFLPLVCDCVKARVAENHWCNMHKDFVEGRATNGGKYFAVNLHNSGTIELRLFAPCSHLIANIQKVLTEFFRVGYRDFASEPNAITCIVNQNEKIEVEEVFKADKQVFDYGFNKNHTYSISPLAQIADFQEYEQLRGEVETGRSYHNYRNYQIGADIIEL